MGGSRSLAELSSVVQRNLAAIDGALKASDQPQPSLDHGSSAAFTIPAGLEKTHAELLEALDETQTLLRGPKDYIYYRTTLSILEIGTYDLLSKFNIPQLLGADETVSYAELGRRAGLAEDDARRIVRGALSIRVFEPVLVEGGEEKIRHNALSSAIATVPELSGFLWLVTRGARAALHASDALRKWPEGPSAASGADASQCGFALAHDGRSFFDWEKDHPDVEADFKKAMTLQSMTPGFNVNITAGAVSWEGKCPETIVDVGGSAGTLAKALLRRYPGIKSAVVQDLAEVVASQPQDSEFAGRLSFAAYDFFQEQPLKGQDVYLFRTILHDWSDDRAAEILRQQIPALKPGARIIVNDFCAPAPGAHTHVRDQPPRAYDLLMRSMCNGKERGLDDWKNLFAKADPRFEIKSVVTPPEGKLSVIEVVWRG